MINLDWSKIDWETFEHLSLDYARSMYPEFEWAKSPSKGYNQDNHDLSATAMGKDIQVAGFSWEEINLNENYEIWGEVKYSNDATKRIGKQQLDPTIVSAIVAGNVIFLLFITNKKFTSNYKIRVERVLAGTTKFFDYTDIDDLEGWLLSHPIYLKKYFSQELTRPKRAVAEVELKEVCFFDLRDLRNKYYSIVKELKLNQEYILFLSVKCSSGKTLSIINIKSLPFVIEALPGFDYKNHLIYLRKGTNNLFLLIRPLRLTQLKEIELVLAGDDNRIYSITNRIKVNINSFREIKIIFSQQEMIIDRLLGLIKNEPQEQLMFLLYAQGGTGKTTILEKIYLEIGPHRQFITLDFTDNKNINAKKIGELILFCNYGEMFEDIPQEIIEKLSANFRYLSPALLKEIKQIASLVDGANERLDSILSIYHDALLINPRRLHQAKIILCDDIHKLDFSAAIAFARILDQIHKDNLNIFMIMTGREHEFSNSELKRSLQQCCPIPFRLNNPTNSDILSTIHHYFKIEKNIITLRTLAEHQLKTIVWKEILKDFDKEINQYPKDNFNLTKYFKTQILEVSQRREAFLCRIFVPFKKQEYLLDAVYSYKNGLNLEKIVSAFKKLDFLDAKIREDIDVLLDENLIRREGQLLFPMHDIYLKEYFRYRTEEKIFTAGFARFFEYYVGSDFENFTLAVSLLLKCNTPEKLKYLSLAKSLRDKYFAVTNFGAALDLSESLVEFYKTSYHHWHTDYESLSADFKYAICLNHCDSLLAAKRVLTGVYTDGIGLTSNNESKTLAYEAKAELFNIKYWLFETDNIIQELDNFIALLNTNYFEYKELEHFSNSYLIALNRLMVFSLLLDDFERAAYLYRQCLQKAEDFSKPEYSGFAEMDYAKGLYHIDIVNALKHLEVAKSFFLKTGQQRRLLDCECEISFLKEINTGSNMTELENCSNKLRDAGLTNLYVKSLLKLAACLLVSGRGEEQEILFLIEKANHSNRQASSPRIDLICANLYTAIKVKFRNGVDKEIEIQKHFACCEKIGYSYRQMAEHNIAAGDSTKVKWGYNFSLTDHSSIVVDPRIW